MKTFNSTVVAFNGLVQQRKFKEALEEFYADDVVFTTNLNPPIVGIAALRTVMEEFLQKVTIEKIELVSLVMEENLSVTNWYRALDHKKFGSIDKHQVSVQRWKDNKIIQENHFYDL